MREDEGDGVREIDELGRRHAAKVHATLADVEPPPPDLVTPSPVSQRRRGAWVALASAIAVAAGLVPLALLTQAPTATDLTPAITSGTDNTEPPTTSRTGPDDVVARFDVELFAASKLGGAFDDFEDRIGVVVVIPSDAESSVEGLLSESSLPELEGYSYLPADLVTAAAEGFADNRNLQPLEGEWVAYGLIPLFNDSPTGDWVVTLRSIPDSVVVRVDFDTPVEQIPEGWDNVADLSLDVASGAVIEAVGTGVVVVQLGSTTLVGFDGLLTPGEEPPLPMTASCCGGEDGLPIGNDLVLIDEGATNTWILETDTMTWHQAEARPSAGYVLGSALVDNELFIVTTVARTGGASTLVGAMDISTGVWRELEPVPSPVSVGGVTTDGERLIIAGTQQGPNNNVIGSRNPVAYQYTSAEGWSQLPDVPIDGQASTIIWVDGAGLLAWNYDLESALLEQSGSWKELGEVPMPEGECYPRSFPTVAGAAGLCFGIAWFEAATQTWSSIRHPSDTKYVVSEDAILGLVQVGRDQTRLIQYTLPPSR